MEDKNSRFEARVIETPFGPLKMCALDYCKQEHSSRGLCVSHYHALREGRPLAPIIRHMAFPPCVIDWCPRLSQTKAKAGLCKVHYQQQWRGIAKELGDFYEPVPYNQNFTEDGTGRVCKTCAELKPVEGFYKRNQHKTPGTRTLSTQCKECYKKDVAYYAGKRATRADGRDPMRWADDPGAMKAHREKVEEENRVRSRAYQQKLKEKKNENV
jgi:hypothetical protein